MYRGTAVRHWQSACGLSRGPPGGDFSAPGGAGGATPLQQPARTRWAPITTPARLPMDAAAQEEVHTLFGARLPFPQEDLFVSLFAVCAFLPAVVVLNALVARLLRYAR